MQVVCGTVCKQLNGPPDEEDEILSEAAKQSKCRMEELREYNGWVGGVMSAEWGSYEWKLTEKEVGTKNLVLRYLLDYLGVECRFPNISYN